MIAEAVRGWGFQPQFFVAGLLAPVLRGWGFQPQPFFTPNPLGLEAPVTFFIKILHLEFSRRTYPTSPKSSASP